MLKRKTSEKRDRKNSVVRDRTKSKTDEDIKTKQYETEKMETGKVELSVYVYYIKNMGFALFGSCVFFFTAYQVFSTGNFTGKFSSVIYTLEEIKDYTIALFMK